LSNLLKRSITGTIYLIILIGSILLGSYSFGLVFLGINILALFEFFKITGSNRFFPEKYTGLLTGSALFIITYLVASEIYSSKLYLLIVPMLVLLFIIELFRNKPFPFVNIGITILGIIYISLPLSLLNYVVFPKVQPDKYTYEIILGYLVLIWTNDTSAYISGITLGKHVLSERISPKKTWEGFIGGALATMIVAFLIHGAFDVINRTDLLVFGIIVSTIGVAGDLVESLLKRSTDIKDTGNILPGHGGILDRIDSILLTSPLVFCYLMLLK
jgi:phosphatidate cytidylyltransferase